MKHHLTIATLLGLAAVTGTILAAPSEAAQNGATAPGFTLTSSTGKSVSLDSYRGRAVVLEWHNPGCPFVQKHYDSGSMQAAQRAAREQGAVWLTINSGSEGKQGYLTPAEAQALAKEQRFNASHYLFDRSGSVGKAYDARTTPHMYVIDGDGVLVYQGAIDDKPTADQADIATARNHVLEALEELGADKPVSVASSRPYGCSVKYPG